VDQFKLRLFKPFQEMANRAAGLDKGMPDANGMAVSQGNPLELVKLANNGALFHSVVKDHIS
jgi:hypothetical protein